MEEYIDDLNILQEYQFVLKKGLGTELQALRIVEGIKKRLQRREIKGTILLDVERAFDWVWRKDLIYKMLHLGIPRSMTHLLPPGQNVSNTNETASIYNKDCSGWYSPRSSTFSKAVLTVCRRSSNNIGG